MWHRLQILVSKTHLAWLKAESLTRGRSIGEIVRDLIDGAISARNKKTEYESSATKD